MAIILTLTLTLTQLGTDYLQQHGSFVSEVESPLSSVSGQMQKSDMSIDIEPSFYELTFTKALQKPRLWCFMLSFSWCTLISVVVGGQFAVIAKDKDPENAAFITDYMYPIIGCVCVAVWGPFVGILASKIGLWILALVMVMSAQMLCLGCFIDGSFGLYFMLVNYSILGAFAYSLQFAYITVAFPTSLYCPLLALTIAVQGTVGFIAWPVLSPDPFGPNAYKKVITLLVVPSFLCYVFPLMQRQNDKYRMNFLNNALARHNDTASIVNAFSKYDRDNSGFLNRDDCKALVEDMYHSLGIKTPVEKDVETVIACLFQNLDQDNDGKLLIEDFQLLAKPRFAKACDQITGLVRNSANLDRTYSTHDLD